MTSLDNSTEAWKYNEAYDLDVSTHGRIRNPHTGNVLRPFLSGGGSSGPSTGSRWRPSTYFAIKAGRDATARTRYPKVHRLVLETFVGECPPGHECDHIDHVRTNNHLSNLRWREQHANRANRDT